MAEIVDVHRAGTQASGSAGVAVRREMRGVALPECEGEAGAAHTDTVHRVDQCLAPGVEDVDVAVGDHDGGLCVVAGRGIVEVVVLARLAHSKGNHVDGTQAVGSDVAVVPVAEPVAVLVPPGAPAGVFGIGREDLDVAVLDVGLLEHDAVSQAAGVDVGGDRDFLLERREVPVGVEEMPEALGVVGVDGAVLVAVFHDDAQEGFGALLRLAGSCRVYGGGPRTGVGKDAWGGIAHDARDVCVGGFGGPQELRVTLEAA